MADIEVMPRVNARNVDLITTCSLNHLDLGPLNRCWKRKVTLGDQVRNGHVIVATIGEVAGVAGGRLLYQLFSPFLALL